MRYLLIALCFLMTGCADKSKDIRERMEGIAFRIDENKEFNSQLYRVNYENFGKANEILNDVFGEINTSDTIKYENVPYVIENVYKHIDICAYAVMLGKRVELITVCRTKDYDRAIQLQKKLMQNDQKDSL